eukprot:TRINITY_DN655_c0_g2_i1.p1 TRINITY_DN655_c0_g2~~TRINITY_DN655_c0_g2_i1.p1  ORF type:complete len:757 (+),score=202.52 TRINITY_DN655_c0_g2_i1:35-2305(+)
MARQRLTEDMAAAGDAAMLQWSFNDFSEEIMFNCLQNLHGWKEALPLTSVSKIWHEMLGPGSGPMWKTYGAQEFGFTNLQAPPAPKDKRIVCKDLSGVDRYASLARAAGLNRALWAQIPTSGLGSREGTPWMFLGRSGNEIFGYGGYGRMGPSNDVMVASISELKKVLSQTSAGLQVDGEDAGEGTAAAAVDPPALDFQPLRCCGRPPLPSYGATLTPLVDDEVPNCEWVDWEVIRKSVSPSMQHALPDKKLASKATIFVVTGGYRYGGYRGESHDWGLGIVCPRSTAKPAQAPARRGTVGGGYNSPSAAAAGASGGYSAARRNTWAWPGDEPSEDKPPAAAEEVAVEEVEGLPQEVLWIKPGPTEMPDGGQNGPIPRSNASAVFVPPRFADKTRYPRGYVMVHGGNVEQEASSSIDILDLDTFVWQHFPASEGCPAPRNSHSAVLMPDAEEPESKAKILVFGGGTGSDIPRAGRDLIDFTVYDPREMRWMGPIHESRREVPGRAHIAVKVSKSVLFFGGGQRQTNQLSALDCQDLSERHAQRVASSTKQEFQQGWDSVVKSLKWKTLTAVKPSAEASGGAPQPEARAFHAGISLAPAGVPIFLIYGGWHAWRGNFGDIWAAKLDAWGVGENENQAGGELGQRARKADSRFQQAFARSTPAAGPPTMGDDDDDDDDPRFIQVDGRVMPLFLFRQLVTQRFGRERASQMLAQMMGRRSQAEDSSEEEEEHDAREEDEDDGDFHDAAEESSEEPLGPE